MWAVVIASTAVMREMSAWMEAENAGEKIVMQGAWVVLVKISVSRKVTEWQAAKILSETISEHLATRGDSVVLAHFLY